MTLGLRSGVALCHDTLFCPSLTNATPPDMVAGGNRAQNPNQDAPIYHWPSPARPAVRIITGVTASFLVGGERARASAEITHRQYQIYMQCDMRILNHR